MKAVAVADNLSSPNPFLQNNRSNLRFSFVILNNEYPTQIVSYSVYLTHSPYSIYTPSFVLCIHEALHRTLYSLNCRLYSFSHSFYGGKVVQCNSNPSSLQASQTAPNVLHNTIHCLHNISSLYSIVHCTQSK